MLDPNDDPMLIGASLWGGAGLDEPNEYFGGYIDEVRIYDINLTQDEIQTIGDLLYVDVPNPLVDFRHDGMIEFRDYAILADNWLDRKFWP